MAGRSLENLRSRYNTAASVGGPGPGPGGPGRNAGARFSGKPKDGRKTFARIFTYISQYKLRIVGALLCMLLNTGASLAGSYMLRPILNHIAEAGVPAAERIRYLLIMLAVLLTVYLIAVAASFLQFRLMVTSGDSRIK